MSFWILSYYRAITSLFYFEYGAKMPWNCYFWDFGTLGVILMFGNYMKLFEKMHINFYEVMLHLYSTRRNIFWYYNSPPWYITNKISLSVVYWKIFTTMVNIFQYTSPWSKKLFLEWKSYIFLLLSHHFIKINVNRQWLVKNIGKYHLWSW